MVDFEISSKALGDIKADGYAIFVEQDFDSKKLSESLSKFFPALEDVIKKRNFTGSAGSALTLSFSVDSRACYLLIYGIGKNKKELLDIEKYRRALGAIVRFCEHSKLDSVALSLPDAKLFGRDIENIAQETAMVLMMADYHFDDFITEKHRKLSRELKFIILSENTDKVKSGIETGKIIAKSVNKARYWCDLPAGNSSPDILSKEYEKFAEPFGVSYKIFGEAEIVKLGMGGVEGVCRGSDHEPRFVIAEYKTDPKNQTLVIVGKGVTFDSGGLSIKPANSMETMKDDMAGSAVVNAVMGAIGQLKPKNINVIAIAPLVENMPSGKAIRPGDVLKFYNGKTAEVKNTDAEGRLILADALSYAVKNYKPDYIIDLATLTGACAAALGPIYAGLFSEHEDIAKKIEESAKHSGDKVWRLPTHEDYKVAIKSDIADICNIGSPRYMSGATTAAYFLQNFVDDVPWAHLDIAGVAFDTPDISYYRPGATAFGVRLLVDLIMNWKK